MTGTFGTSKGPEGGVMNQVLLASSSTPQTPDTTPIPARASGTFDVPPSG
jgi:hypothetical protein